MKHVYKAGPGTTDGPLVVLGMNEYAARAIKAHADRCVLVIAAKHRATADLELLRRVRTIVVSSLDSVDEIVCALSRSPHGPYSAIWTNREDSVVTTSLLGTALGLEAVPLEVATLFRDKFVQKERLAGSISTARARLVQSSAQNDQPAIKDGDLPLVVKPVAGTATRGVRVVRSREDLDAAVDDVLDRSGEAICETFVDCDDELHLDGSVRSGRLNSLMISTYGASALEIRSGLFLGRLVLDSRTFAPTYGLATDWVARVLASLGLRDGVFHIEAFARVVDHQVAELTFGEAAARVGGADIPSSFQETVGRDLFDEAISAALGTQSADAFAVPGSATCSLWLPSLPPEGTRAESAAQVLAGLSGRPHLVHVKPQIVPEAMRSDTSVFGAILRGSGDSSDLARSAAEGALDRLRRDLHWDTGPVCFTTDKSRLLGDGLSNRTGEHGDEHQTPIGPKERSWH